MPKAGKYDYPFYDLDSALEKLQMIHDTLRQDEVDRSVVAETLGMAERGGGFAYLISSMEKYGLVKTGGGKITITALGKVALYGESEEQQRARVNAVFQVALFKELFEQYGEGATEEQVRAFLRQKAFVDVAKAQTIAPIVNRMYKNLSRYISSAEAPTQPSAPMAKGEGRSENLPAAETETLEIRYRGLFIQIPPNDIEAVELAEKALAFLKKEMLEKKKPSHDEEQGEALTKTG